MIRVDPAPFSLRPARLALVLGLALALAGLAGCGGDDSAERLEKATRALEKAMAQVEDAEAKAEARRQEVEEARKKLAKAEEDLSEARQRLEKARAEVEADATDTLVFRSVQRRLLDDPELEGVAIVAQVQGGVVTLSGDVPDEGLRKRAVEIARATPGVARVQDRIRIASDQPEKTGT